MAATIQELFTAPTAAQFRATMVSALVNMNIPADKWRAGGVASTILTVVSMSLALMATLVAGIVRGFFLPTATGDGLKLLAQYLYGVTVPEATFATGDVILTNVGGGIYNIDAGQYTAKNTSTEMTYTNVDAFVLGAGASVTVSMRATVAGTAGNAVPGAIDANVTTLIGVTPSNPSALIGIDAPNDAAIRALCTNSLGVRSVRGVRSAYAYAVQVAVNPVTLAPVNINRWAIVADSHVGTVDIYVASPSGAPDANDVTGVANSVELNARPEAVVANTFAATAVPYTASITLWCSLPTGTSSSDALAAAQASLAAFISNYPIGGVVASDDSNSNFQGLFGSGAASACASGITSFGGTVLSVQGATDLALAFGEVATNSTMMGIRVVTPLAGTVT